MRKECTKTRGHHLPLSFVFVCRQSVELGDQLYNQRDSTSLAHLLSQATQLLHSFDTFEF